MRNKTTSLIILFAFFFTSISFSQNWQTMSATKSLGGSINYINSVSNHGDTLCVGTSTGVWCSPSGNGGDWIQFGTGLNSSAVTQVFVSGNYGVAFVGGTVYYLNSSKVWTTSGLTGCGSVAMQATTGYMFASKDYTGVYRSINHGLNWTLYNTTNANENLVGPTGPIGIHPTKRIWAIYCFENLVIANSKNAVHISENNGANWYYRWGDMLVDHGAGSNIKGMYFYNYKGVGQLFVSTDGTMWNGMSPNINRSADTGVHYPNYDGASGATILGLPYSSGEYFVDYAHYSSRAMFIRTGGNNIYKSNDNGLNWALFENSLTAYTQKDLIATTKKLILADYYGMYFIDLTTGPSWTATYPKLANITGSSAEVTVNANSKGKAYYVALPSAMAAPTANQVLDGQDASGTMAAVKGSFNVPTANTNQMGVVTGMLSLTAYKIYVVTTNEIGNTGSVASLSLTTLSATLAISQTGLGSTTPASGAYVGTVNISATPAANYRFDKWTINGTSIIKTPNTSVNMNTDINAIATFVQVANLNVTGNGSGNAFPAGLTVQDAGKSVTIRAYPATGYKVTKYVVNGTAFNTSATSRNVTVSAAGSTVVVHFALIVIPPPSLCDTMLTVTSLPRPNNTWEAAYKTRLNNMYGSRVMSYDNNRSYAGTDAGKWYWPEKLAKMKYDSNNLAYYIGLAGNAMSSHTPGAGSFYYPFTGAGYAMYYFIYKDSIMKYDPAQIDSVEASLYYYNEWKYMMRRDQYLDILYPTGKEFNSENFQWMLRCAGHLLSHEFHTKNGHNNYNLSFTDADGIDRANVNITGYFDGYVNNLVRALYSSGRVEWNSNNYWAHTMNPLLALYEGADRCNNPEGSQMKKKAEACLDYMTIEAALHFLDGYQIAADARAKSGYIDNNLGSVETYSYAYFVDAANHPTYSTTAWNSSTASSETGGFILTSSYRPPQIVIDMAQRKFPMPVEVQSAKPFYAADFGDFWNIGESPYNDWKGVNRARRFEFETVYLDTNFTMSSIAGGRPDGAQGTFSEQAQWEIGVKGTNNGAKQITGNASDYWYSPAGRCPQHEIGQFRNIMIHLVKEASSNQFYILVPDPSSQIASSGLGTVFEWNGQNLYLDLGNNVYMACRPYAATGHTFSGSSQRRITWNFTNNSLGGLVIEMGKKAQYGSFANFKTQVQAASLSSINTNTIEYVSPKGNTMRMEYTAPITNFMMSPGTFDTPTPNPLAAAGNYPIVTGNGDLIDYTKWDCYKTVYGAPLINQKWGGALMKLNVGGNEATITIDTITSKVTYSMKNSSLPNRKADLSYTAPTSFSNASIIDPSFNITTVEWDYNNDATYEETGSSVTHDYGVSGTQTVGIKVNTDANCYYQTVKSVSIIINEIDNLSDAKISVYPIPAETYVNIEFGKELASGTKLILVDVDGKIILERTLQSNESNYLIDVSGMKVGCYILSIKDSEKSIYTGRIIVK